MEIDHIGVTEADTIGADIHRTTADTEVAGEASHVALEGNRAFGLILVDVLVTSDGTGEDTHMPVAVSTEVSALIQ